MKPFNVTQISILTRSPRSQFLLGSPDHNSWSPRSRPDHISWSPRSRSQFLLGSPDHNSWLVVQNSVDVYNYYTVRHNKSRANGVWGEIEGGGRMECFSFSDGLSNLCVWETLQCHSDHLSCSVAQNSW